MSIMRRSIILIVASMLVWGLSRAQASAQSISFTVAPGSPYATVGSYDTVVSYGAVATGDFNGDGNLDLAAAHQGDGFLDTLGGIDVLLGNGDGTFQAPHNFANFAEGGTSSPIAVAAADLNNDGKLDLLVLSTNGNLYILLGNGDGTFQATRHQTVGLVSYSLAVGDFNGDGTPDVVLKGSDSVKILLGNGDGSFQTAVSFATSFTPSSISVGDFNNDGKVDLALGASSASYVAILLGNGDGTFQAEMDTSIGLSGAVFAFAGDFNKDGKLDLAVTSPNNTKIAFLPGKGDGTFLAEIDTGLKVVAPNSLIVGDFNKDGNLDLAGRNYSNNSFGILTGNGDGTFQTEVTFSIGNGTSGPLNIVGGDFNHDGRLDLGTGNFGGGISILLNTTPPAPAATTVTSSVNPAPVGTRVTFTATVAASGTPTGTVQFMDGTVALGPPVTLSSSQATYTTGSLASGLHSVHAIYSGDADFAVADSAPSPLIVGPSPGSVAEGDFNGDGIPDLAVADQGGGVAVLLGSGGGAFQAATDYAASDNPYSVTVGDFNHDGNQDLALAPAVGSFVSILLGNGDGTFQPGMNTNLSLSSAPVFAMGGDFNKDGKLDLAVATASDGKLSILLGNGDGTFQSPINNDAGAKPAFVAKGDFNHDGKPDLAVADLNGGVDILLGNGDGTLQAGVAYDTSDTPSSVAVGDFNGDGFQDLALATHNPNVAVLLGNGDGTFQAPAEINTGLASSPAYVTVDDFNHDGKLDLAVATGTADKLTILLGNGDGTFQPPVNFATGQFPDAIVAADLNRDGKLDLVATNATDNTASILLGDGSGNFSEPLVEGIGVLPTASVSDPPAFPPTVVSETSSPETATLTDAGEVPLDITGVNVTGDFTIASNSCTATIAAGQSCTVEVTFSPTVAGTSTGTISFTDNASNSPQTVNLSGSGQDFTLDAQTISQTVSPGSAVTYSLQLSPEGGFNKPVSLSCSGEPLGSTCTVTPTLATPDGAKSISVGMKVTTTGNAMLIPGDPGTFNPPSGSAPMAGWLSLFSLLGLVALGKFTRRANHSRRLVAFAALALLVTLAVSCGSGGMNTSTITNKTTPAGTYTLTVKGTSGNLTHTASVTLKVQ